MTQLSLPYLRQPGAGHLSPLAIPFSPSTHVLLAASPVVP